MERLRKRKALLRALRGLLAFILFALAQTALAGTASYTTPGSWTFTVPANVYSVTVTVTGGGGGGGGYDTVQSNNGGASLAITATIAVVPGQILSGTVGQGGGNGYTGGTGYSGGVACAGSGPAGTGGGSGGAGGNANCQNGGYSGGGYSGGGGGGGGGSTLLLNGTGLIIAGGGGGAGGGSNNGVGAAGSSVSGYVRQSFCGTGSAGSAGSNAGYDGSGGGGGGGGLAGGAGGASAPDGSVSGGGGAGTSCVQDTNLITAISTGTGAAGGVSSSSVVLSSNGAGGNGSVTITYATYSGAVGRHQDCATEYGNGGGATTTPASAKSTTTCIVPYATTVRYYDQNTMGYSQSVTASIACSNSTFGDPDYGIPKICAYDVIALSANQAVTSLTATVGSSIPATTPASGTLGLAPYSYAISPALPSGLTFNTSTGQISGTPTTASATTTYTVTITDTANQSTFDAVFTAAGQQTSQSVTRTFTLTVNPPVSVSRATSLVSDPVNGATNPKAIPGAILQFAITVSNAGTGAVGTDSMFLSDALAPQVAVGTGAAPTLTQGSPSSSLTLNTATDVAYSNSNSAPASFSQCTYSPTKAYDPAVKFICFNPKGSMSGSSGTAPSFTIAYQAQVQ